MKIDKFTTKVTGDSVLYSAEFNFLKSELNQVIWFKVNKDYQPNIFPYNSFFIAGYFLALTLQENLNFNGPISAELVKNASEIGNLLNMGTEREIEIEFTKETNIKEKGRDVGQFFTLGLDSFYTLLCFKSPPNKTETIKYLIFVEGYDVSLKAKWLLKDIRKRVDIICAKKKTTPIYIQTNLRDLSEKIINWEMFHGVGLVAAGLLLPKVLNKIYINSSDAYLFNVSWGTGTIIDSLWSSKNMVFSSFGEKLDRLEKTLELTKNNDHDLVFNHIRSCWENISYGRQGYNCCKCEKCLRTYFGFISSGAGWNIPAFKNIDFDDLKNVDLTHHIQRIEIWKKILYRLREKYGNNHTVVKLISKRLSRQHHLSNCFIKINLRILKRIFYSFIKRKLLPRTNSLKNVA